MNKPAIWPKAVKLVAIGNSTGIVLPKEMLARMGLAQGDLLDVVEVNGGLEFRRHEPDLAEEMAVAREVMLRRRTALRELAK